MIEVNFSQLILDHELYKGYKEKDHVENFEIGDYIVYFMANATWRAEVVGKIKGGYEVKDY